MSQQLINHSKDLKRLQDEGYNIEIKSNYLLIKNVPYLTSAQKVQFGSLVSELSMAGDVTTKPNTHVVYFAGEYPCNNDGSKIVNIQHSSGKKQLNRDIEVDHSFSSKPSGGYKDYYHKMTTYVAIISSPAHSVDPNVTAKTFPVIISKEGESVFYYIDTASSRAGITFINRKLELGRVGIVGLGGTGSYVLDLVAKSPVREICLYDADKFSQHNAFRTPGAPSIEELREEPQKVIT
jgi:hypothetical protein